MVNDKFIDSLELDREKAEIIKIALKKDSFYRKILYKVGVAPGAIEPILNMTDTSVLDESQADILEEKARIEWADFITTKNTTKKVRS